MNKQVSVSLLFVWLSVIFPITVAAQAQPEILTPNQMFLNARNLVSEQRYEEARALCEEILAINPEYHEAAILKARTFAWQGQYSQAISVLESLLANNPDITDAVVALVNTYIWSGNYNKAIPYLEKLIEEFPTDNEFLFNKALALHSTGDHNASAEILNQILNQDPSNAKAIGLLLEVQQLRIRNHATIGYRGVLFDAVSPWHMYLLEYGMRSGALGAIVTRLNIAQRRGLIGTQAEIDVYPSLAPGTSIYLNIGFSPDTRLFPQFRGGAELFRSFSDSWEASAGLRFLSFTNKNLWIATGSLSYYLGQYIFTFRPFLGFTTEGTGSQSYFLVIRRFFSSPTHHLTLTVGTGFSADQDALIGAEIYDVASNNFILHYQQPVFNRFILRIGAGYQHIPEGIWGSKYTIETGITYLF